MNEEEEKKRIAEFEKIENELSDLRRICNSINK